MYTLEFGLCGLAQDETSVVSLMRRTAAYSRGDTTEPYPLKDALQDAYMAILLQKADASQKKISSFIYNKYNNYSLKQPFANRFPCIPYNRTKMNLCNIRYQIQHTVSQNAPVPSPLPSLTDHSCNDG